MNEELPVLGVRALNRALLARQLLTQRASISAEEAISRLLGMQSQAPNPPYLGLWTRLAGFETEHLAQLMLDRCVVRLVLMRSTIHLVTAADACAVRPLVQPALERTFASSQHAKKLPGLELGPVAAAGRSAVEACPLTFSELGTVLAAQWPKHDPSALAQVVRVHVPLVQVPPRGIWGRSGQARHTSLAAWVGASRAAPHTIDALVLRYLGAFGPASVADAQTWSGLTRLRAVFERLTPQVLRFRDENGVVLYDLPEAPRPDPQTPVPVRLLPEFDNILLAHAIRTRIVSEQDRHRLFTVNGIIPGSVLVDGFVAALWKIARTRTSATLTVTPFRPLSTGAAAAVTVEAQRLLDFAVPQTPTRTVVLAEP